MEKIFRKKTGIAVLSLLLVCIVALAGCTSAGSADQSTSESYKNDTKQAQGIGFNGDMTSDEPQEQVDEGAQAPEAGATEGDMDVAGAAKQSEAAQGENSAAGSNNANKQNTTNRINDEKLIYNCSITIDSLDYPKAIKSFRSLIEKYDGFLQNENETDNSDANQNDNYYIYYGNQNKKDGRIDKRYTYTATVRVPSKNYNAFVEETGDIGDVRNKNAHVDNITQNYYDLKAELEVLETKYQRFLEMLKKAKTTTEILEIENSITSLETQINQIKTTLNRYDNDVAYSYVNVSIRQVKEYAEEETDTSTVGGAVESSWDSFCDFLHEILIGFIYMLPYLLVIAVITLLIIFIVRMATRKSRRQRKERAKAQAAQMEEAQNGFYGQPQNDAQINEEADE